MSRRMIALSVSLWGAAIAWLPLEPHNPGPHRVILAAAITASICTALQHRALSDRELAELALLAGQAMRSDARSER